MSPDSPISWHVHAPFTTERLVLRAFRGSDLEALVDIQSRPEVARYLYWEPRSHPEVVESLARKMDSTRIEAEGDMLSLAVVPRSGGPLIGDLTLMYRSAGDRTAEIGYVFHPDHQGRGLATEATRALIGLAFSHLGLHRVWAALDARNSRSAALLERLGLRLEAHFKANEWVKGEWTDELIYAVLADEWGAPSRSV